MVVEDDEGVRELVRLMLEANGYEVLTVADAEEATRLCTVRGIDLLLTDVVMPEVSGSELAERLGALAPDMRILFMSGYSDEAVVRHGELTRGGRVPREAVHGEGARAQGARGARRGLAAARLNGVDRLLHVGEVRRARRQELVRLVVGHRAVGEQGDERRAGVDDAGRARLGLRDRGLDLLRVAVAAPGAALRGRVDEWRRRGRREHQRQ